MSGVVKIRDARIGDADSMAALYVDAWRTAYAGMVPDKVLIRMSKRDQAMQWAHAIAARPSTDAILVAELGRAGIIAFGSCGPARRTILDHAGEIYTLYVRPGFQDRGLGRELLHRLFDRSIENDLTSALVWVLSANPARYFYEAMGGRRVAERTERLWGCDLPQAAYAWADLRTVNTPRRSAREQ
ncbi:MAG TPA: GNAT family N-acetyltransferase [Rhodospirillales bacterium]|nr:GNAT family N-acetyltransferase [Rhodospirillales bacterium]